MRLYMSLIHSFLFDSAHKWWKIVANSKISFVLFLTPELAQQLGADNQHGFGGYINERRFQAWP